jgi:Resolvase, N terminal domain
MADAEARRFDVVIVHKLDRFARNLRLTLETLDRLERAGVGFISISEDMDFSTPMGRVVLSTMGSLAQFYSDNLSTETKKGKRERKAQGLYNGVLPFGARKGDYGVPVTDPSTHPGLVLAYELAAGGKTDREVARALNDAGYRTSGNRGANLFSRDTVACSPTASILASFRMDPGVDAGTSRTNDRHHGVCTGRAGAGGQHAAPPPDRAACLSVGALWRGNLLLRCQPAGLRSLRWETAGPMCRAVGAGSVR